MTLSRSFRFRLYPTEAQSAKMDATANARRFVYNLCLEQRRDFWRQAKAAGIGFNYVTQGREVTQLRREVEWLSAVSADALLQAVRDLDAAFRAFFARRSGFPQFQSKFRHMGFRMKGCSVSPARLSNKWGSINVPNVGRVKMRLSRDWQGRIVNATFSKNPLGWHVSLACEVEHETPANYLPAVGIDRGVANTLALSTGELLSTPDVSALERRKRKAQRILTRRQKGSMRYEKQRRRVASLAARMARVRDNWQHRASMVRANRGLARSIHEQGWNGFALKLAYKLEERGGMLIKINPAYTSQECSACGVIDKASRESQASFACRHCGHTAHADVNAALNILSRSSAVVEGSGYAPVEARTKRACNMPDRKLNLKPDLLWGVGA
jgi:putative transposase